MKLKKLIEDISGLHVKGSKEVEITGLSANSNAIGPGNLFIAKKGLHHDGTRFIYDALDAGAIAILTDMVDPFVRVTQLIHPDVASIEAKLAARFYQNPSKKLKLIGITGTNGKTTTSYLIKHLFEKVEAPAGLIGTIEWIVGDHRFPGGFTTPDVLTNHKLLHEMHLVGCKAAIMEVSSHGLSQNRVGEMDFDTAVFTNLSQDHLDYHKDMQSYSEAKGKLFMQLSEGKWAIFNADDPTRFPTKAKILTYGIDQQADVQAVECKLTDKKTQFAVIYQGEKVLCKSPLIGKFNVYNLLAAISVGLASGISLETCVYALKSFKGVPGRLERVKHSNIFVDYAHTEAALKNVCETFNEIKQGRLIVVFGCGGDRDQYKREKMGKVVSELSDIAIITNDNPRSEDPLAIAEAILKGFKNPSKAILELDRKEAIVKAIHMASDHDIVLIAGKGHEKTQIYAHQILPFDDIAIARQIYEDKACAN